MPGSAGDIPDRVYVPKNVPASPMSLLSFMHGGDS